MYVKTFYTFCLFLSLQTVFGQDKTQASKPSPFVLGVINEIQSVELGEKRILNIYLPEGYTEKNTTQYPVIYLLDGSADEDFIHIVGLVQFNTFSWINRIPKTIVVGIANVDRKRDFTYPTGIEADKKRYKTAGHSDKFIIISPSLWWDDGSLLTQKSDIFLDNFSQKTDIYIGVGKEGLGPSDIPHVMEVDANLLTEKIHNTKSKNVKVYFDYLPQEDHATVTHQAVFNAFRLLYPLK